MCDYICIAEDHEKRMHKSLVFLGKKTHFIWVKLQQHLVPENSSFIFIFTMVG